MSTFSFYEVIALPIYEKNYFYKCEWSTILNQFLNCYSVNADVMDRYRANKNRKYIVSKIRLTNLLSKNTIKCRSLYHVTIDLYLIRYKLWYSMVFCESREVKVAQIGYSRVQSLTCPGHAQGKYLLRNFLYCKTN
jgi:hypothetical protein